MPQFAFHELRLSRVINGRLGVNAVFCCSLCIVRVLTYRYWQSKRIKPPGPRYRLLLINRNYSSDWLTLIL